MPTNPASLAVTDAYRQRMLNIRREGERAARAVWGDVDAADLMGTYLVAPLATAVSALQRTGVLLSSGYVKAFIKSEIGKDVLIPTPRGFTGTSFADVELRAALLRPVVLVKKLEAEGVPQGEAMMRGRKVLLRTVALATDSAVRDSLQNLYEKRPEVIGWQRAVAGTCDKCMGAADGSTLPPGTPLNVHPNCECVSEAVVSEALTAADRKRLGKLDSLKTDTKDPATVPMLQDLLKLPDDAFQRLNELGAKLEVDGSRTLGEMHVGRFLDEFGKKMGGATIGDGRYVAASTRAKDSVLHEVGHAFDLFDPSGLHRGDIEEFRQMFLRKLPMSHPWAMPGGSGVKEMWADSFRAYVLGGKQKVLELVGRRGTPGQAVEYADLVAKEAERLMHGRLGQ